MLSLSYQWRDFSKEKNHKTVVYSVIPPECTWSLLEVQYSRACLVLGWETTENPTGASQWAMLNYRKWISSKTPLGSAFMTELLKNRRRRVVGLLSSLPLKNCWYLTTLLLLSLFFPLQLIPSSLWWPDLALRRSRRESESSISVSATG